MNEIELELLSHAILRRESPTNALLTKWEQSNPTITQLYVYLGRMQHKRAMLLLRRWVEPKLQALCDIPNSSSDLQMLHDFLVSSKVVSKLPSSVSPSCSPNTLNGTAAATLNMNRLPMHDAPVASDRRAHHGVRMSPVLDRLEGGKCLIPVDVPESEQCEPFSAAASTVNAYDDDLPYNELLTATNNFCKSNIIGSGGFGVVYKGFWKGTKVAIKRLKDCGDSLVKLTFFNMCLAFKHTFLTFSNLLPGRKL